MKTRYYLFVALLIVLVMLTSCSAVQAVIGPTPTPTETPCYIAAADYIEQVNKLASDWDATNSLANQTPRNQLANVILKLQDVRNTIDKLNVPECAQSAHDLLMEYMDHSIDGYMSFMGDDPDTTVNQYFKDASADFDSWEAEYLLIQLGQYLPTATP